MDNFAEGWYAGMDTASLRQEAERAEKEAAQWEKERQRQNEDAAERRSLIARIDAAKRKLISRAL
jgi:hypothetical protein